MCEIYIIYTLFFSYLIISFPGFLSFSGAWEKKIQMEAEEEKKMNENKANKLTNQNCFHGYKKSVAMDSPVYSFVLCCISH